MERFLKFYHRKLRTITESQFFDEVEKTNSKEDNVELGTWEELKECTGNQEILEDGDDSDGRAFRANKTWGGDTFVQLGGGDDEDDEDVSAHSEQLTEEDENGVVDGDPDYLGLKEGPENDDEEDVLDGTKTYNFLLKHRHGGKHEFDRNSVARTAMRWSVGKNGELLVKSFDEDEYREATKDEADELMRKKSYKYVNNDRFVFIGDKLMRIKGVDVDYGAETSDLVDKAKNIPHGSYKGLTKRINEQSKIANDFEVCYRFNHTETEETRKDKKSGEKRKVTVKHYDGTMSKLTGLTEADWEINDDQIIPLYTRPDSDWESLDDEDKEFICSVLDKGDKERKAADKQIVYKYDYDNKKFLKSVGGREFVEMTPDEIKTFINKTGSSDKSADSEYWDKFYISTSGSKVGESVGNFSLPPVVTCARKVRCAKEGCYAIKAYAAYATSRAAWGKNYVMLKEGRYQQFENELIKFLNNEKNPIKLFRFNVSGDLFDKKYLDSIINIATNTTGVQFWLYTKRYDLVTGISLPDNLHIILSAWGDLVPSVELQREFPVAYLDDEKADIRYLDKIGDTVKIVSEGDDIKDGEIIKVDTGDGKTMDILKRKKCYCPCTLYSDSGTHCEKCEACFRKLWSGKRVKYNLVFNKH